MVLPLAVIGGGMLLGGALNYLGNRQQAKSSEKSLDAQLTEAAAAREFQRQQADQARGIIADQGLRGMQGITGAKTAALNYYDKGQASQLGVLQGSAQQGLAELYGGRDQARLAMQSGTQQGLASLYGGVDTGAMAARQGLGGYEQAIGQGTGMAAQAIQGGLEGSRLADLYSTDFTTDPGYEFQRQQGEEAILRNAAARGGRSGGRTMKALADYNQGLASQAYGDWYNRNAAIGGQLDAANQSAASQLAGLYSGAGQNIGAQRAALGTNLAGLYAGAGQQAAGMESGLGQNLGALYQGTGQQAADIYGNLGSNEANVYGQTAAQKAGAYQNMGSQIADLYSQNAVAQANVLTGSAAQNTALSQSMMPAYAAPTQYAGQGLASMGNTAQNMASNYAFWSMMNQGR